MMVKKSKPTEEKPQTEPLWKRDWKAFCAFSKVRFVEKRLQPVWKKVIWPIIKPMLGVLKIIGRIFHPFLTLLSFLSWIMQRSWKAVSNHKVFATVVAFALSSSVAGVFHVYITIQDNFIRLENSLRDITAVYESTYAFCREAVVDPHKLTNFEKWRLDRYTGLLAVALADLNKKREALGKLTDYRTYLMLHALACRVDFLAHHDVKVCGVIQLNRTRVDRWRDSLIKKVTANKELHRTLYYKYWRDPIDYWFGKDPSDETYKNPGCSLKLLNYEIEKTSALRHLPHCQFGINYRLFCGDKSLYING